MHDEKAKKEKPIWIYIVGIVALGLAISAVFLVGGKACSAQHHSKYATGSEYAAVGHVVKADKDVKRNGSDHKTKTTVYEIEIAFDEALPTGEATYTSSEESDYDIASKVRGSSRVEFTIDANGYLKEAKNLAGDPDSINES